MTDFNLNFDTGSKNISLAPPSSSGNLGFVPDVGNAHSTSPIQTIGLSGNQPPKLSVTDPAGFEMLTTGKTPDILQPPTSGYNSGNDSVRSPEPVKPEFSFFKPSDPVKDVGGIVDGNLDTKNIMVNPDEAIFMSKESTEAAQGFKPIHRLSPQDIKNEKIDLIYKFKKLEGQGIRTTMNYNMNSHLEDMRNEYIKLKKQREVDNSVKFQRKMLMACVTGLEFMNGRFDPFSVKLDGWSESVNENLNDYDEIFEELGDKYGGAGEMSPEIRLLFTLAGSAFMFHLSNTMFKSSIPGMDDVLRQNPELMQQFAQAAVGTMNNGPQTPQVPQPPPMSAPQNPLAAMMGMGGGGGGNPLASMMNGLMGPMMGQGASQPNHSGPAGGHRTTSPARSDMSGPDGIDELITKMHLEPDKIPDLDNLSLMSGDSGGRGSGGITLNL